MYHCNVTRGLDNLSQDESKDQMQSGHWNMFFSAFLGHTDAGHRWPVTTVKAQRSWFLDVFSVFQDAQACPGIRWGSVPDPAVDTFLKIAEQSISGFMASR